MTALDRDALASLLADYIRLHPTPRSALDERVRNLTRLPEAEIGSVVQRVERLLEEPRP